MSEEQDAPKLSVEEQRRLRRQKRILEAGSNRLNKITATFTGQPVAQEQDPVVETRVSQGAADREASNGATETRRNLPDAFERMSSPSAFDGSEDLTQQQLFEQLRATLGGGGGSGSGGIDAGSLAGLFAGVGGTAGSAASNKLFETLLTQLPHQQQPSSRAEEPGATPFGPERTEGKKVGGGESGEEERSSARWKFLHFFAVFALVAFVVFSEIHRAQAGPIADFWSRFASLATNDPNDLLPLQRVLYLPVFWYLVTLELVLQSSQLFLRGPPPASTAAAFTTGTLQQLLLLFSRYGTIWKNLVTDICSMIFLFGLLVGIAGLMTGAS